MIDTVQAAMSSMDVKHQLVDEAPLAKLSLLLTVDLFGSLPNIAGSYRGISSQANSVLTY